MEVTMTKLPTAGQPNLASLTAIAIGGISTLLACTSGPVPLGSSLSGGNPSPSNSGTSASGGTSTDQGSSPVKPIDFTTVPVEAGVGGAPGGSTACSDDLLVVYRDFRSAADATGPRHPDFENVMADDRGLVQPMLGSDQKPVYAPAGASRTVSGADSFNQWYRDVDGVNIRFEETLPLTPSAADPSAKSYTSQAFYPLDGLAGSFGNQGQTHNYAFTTEIHTSFTYKGGEIFSFQGDDDVFTYVDNKLVIDLGGVHTVQSATIDFDKYADILGLVKGQTYNMDIFHAERHTTQSNFKMQTKFDCLVSRIIP
jgi:fibro-slime domain-containing protein